MFELIKITACLYVTILALTSCSSAPRTKWTDATLRVAISPEGIDSDSYVRIQASTVASGKFFVVDRADAFRAVVREQDMTRVNASESRFEDEEKFARLRRLHGVGGVIQAHLQCANKHSIFRGNVVYCHEYVSLVSTNTGAVIAAAEAEVEPPEALWNGKAISPSWEEVINKLCENIPANFEPEKWSEDMKHYKKVNAAEAQTEREQREKASLPTQELEDK